MLKKTIFFFLFFPLATCAMSQSDLRIEPPFWWEGMKLHDIQLVVYGENIAGLQPVIQSKEVVITNITRPGNVNYMFIDIAIDIQAKSGFEIQFLSKTKKIKNTYYYDLKKRGEGSPNRVGVNSSDAIYLLMPDRFSNGVPENDSFSDMPEKVNRDSLSGRHGGDIRGIINHLDYIRDMGFTAIWTNPVLENNMFSQSYHGYAITDFYRVDRRLGSNEDYLELVSKSHKMGIKVVKDMIFNHAGTRNYLIQEPPMKDWVHVWPEYTSSNYRGEVISDPYASTYDYIRMNNGWFDTTMADLNQSNPFVLHYLVQNSIWWIEYAGIDAVRMDTYPYPDKDAMAKWAETVMEEYPGFTIIGEAWLKEPALTSYWQKDACHTGGYNSYINSVFDFPLYFAVNKSFTETESWEKGWSRIYTILCQDRLYPNPNDLVIFPDNHDLERFSEVIGGNIDKYKLAMAFYATTRGIPQFYYGTEIMMGSKPYFGHGSLRKEFPGGWTDTSKNAFTGKGLSSKEAEAQTFMKDLLNWRKDKEVIHTGNLKHFIPENGLYVYCRYNNSESVVVILNKNTASTQFIWDKYKELIIGHEKAIDILSGKEYSLQQPISLAPVTPLILELK
jgi:neopullulanase